MEAVSNCSMIDLFMSQFQGAEQLRPRAASFGFYEVLQTVWAYISGLISTAKRSISYSSPKLASRWCAWILVPQMVWLKKVLPYDMHRKNVRFSHGASQSIASLKPGIQSTGVQTCPIFTGVSLALADRLILTSFLL